MIKLYENWVNEASASFDIDLIKYGHSGFEFKEKVIKSSFLKDWSDESGFCEEIIKRCPKNSDPSTRKELLYLVDLMKSATLADLEFARLSDLDQKKLFVNFIREKGYHASCEELHEITNVTDPLLFCLKEKVNRPRPFQLGYYLNISVYPLIVTDAMHAAFPSGHSFDAANFAKYYSMKYPDITKEVHEFALKTAMTRIYTGIHYPSDHEISLYISDAIWNNDIFLEYIQETKNKF
jgi:hypothetical protein